MNNENQNDEQHPTIEGNVRGHARLEGAPKGIDWERDLLARLAMSSLNEQRRARRWGIFFKALVVIYFTVFLVMITKPEWGVSGIGKEHTAVINVSGIIASDALANAEAINASLRAAFKDENTTGVILRINSPGGSPVQSGLIYDEMLRLRQEYPEIPLYAVIEDLGASGGYYIAAGAEKIYADKASIVGSIGVRWDGFGFVKAIDKLGIERRLMTAGENKGFWDPFLPEQDNEKEHVQTLLNEVHQQFINAIRSSRGDRLKEDGLIYSGLFWTGEKSLALGLIDGLGNVHYVAREIFKQDKIQDFSPRKDYWERIFSEVSVSVSRQIESLFYTQSMR